MVFYLRCNIIKLANELLSIKSFENCRFVLNARCHNLYHPIASKTLYFPISFYVDPDGTINIDVLLAIVWKGQFLHNYFNEPWRFCSYMLSNALTVQSHKLDKPLRLRGYHNGILSQRRIRIGFIFGVHSNAKVY